MSVIDDLKSSRLAQGRSVREVAETAGLHENTIRNAESGRNSPSLEALEAWATALGEQIVVSGDAKKLASSAELTPTPKSA